MEIVIRCITVADECVSVTLCRVAGIEHRTFLIQLRDQCTFYIRGFISVNNVYTLTISERIY